MYPVDARSEPMVVRFNQLPDGWHIATPLDVLAGRQIQRREL